MTDQWTHRGWSISYDPKPIPIRSFDWTATGPDFDCSWEGEEDGYVSSGGSVSAASRQQLIQEIDDWYEEQDAPHIPGCRCRECENLWDQMDGPDPEVCANCGSYFDARQPRKWQRCTTCLIGLEKSA